MEANLTPIIKESFLQFSGAVLQSRALVDARDMLKPSARQIFYCLYTDKFIHEKPFQKTLKAIGSSFRVFIHGDSSAEGVIMRAGQPFAMRYPLMDIEGSYGTLLASNSWSAPRYTGARLSALSNYLFKDIDKEVITEWRDNYDNTEQYPSVLPSKGFYNIVNGSFGLGVGASASIPQYNLKELNEVLIKLLWNPDIDFEDIFIAPDFATGAILLNLDEVKESHRTGRGKACKLRSVIEWDKTERCLIVKEIPYMVYTETICKELEEIINGDENPGFERFNDLTGISPLIKIYLSKNYSPEKALKFLYKNTSLQSYYGINFTILEDGRYPKTFTWKELLQSHISHEKLVYIRGFEYDLKKIKARLHIIEGLIKAYDMIDEVVQTIKSSSSSAAASTALQELLSIDDIQAKAILELKLARLSKLDINKLFDEQNQLNKERDRIELILNNEALLKKEIEKGLREVAEKFGDERRTKILNIEKENDEPIDNKKILVNLTNQNNIIVYEVSSLYTQKRGGVGNKIKLNNGEYVISTESCESINIVNFYSNRGKYYSIYAKDLPLLEKFSLESIFKLEDGEHINNISAISKNNSFIIFITKKGLIKKSYLNEYKLNTNGIKAIDLNPGDEICSILITESEKIGILTEKGHFLVCNIKDVNPVGRIARGRKCISLNEDDIVRQAEIITDKTNEIIFCTDKGNIKKIKSNLIPLQTLNTKGKKIYKTDGNEVVAGFLPLENNEEIIINATNSMVKIKTNEIPLLSLNAQGSSGIKLINGQKVIGLSK